MILACPNSDGLSQFMWSHDGFWFKGGALVGKKDTDSKCAEDCIEDDKCVAINYYHSGIKKEECYIYYGRANLNKGNQIANSHTKTRTKAYVRCQGIENNFSIVKK